MNKRNSFILLKLRNRLYLRLKRLCTLPAKKFLESRKKRRTLFALLLVLLVVRLFSSRSSGHNSTEALPIVVVCHQFECKPNELIRKLRFISRQRPITVFCGSEDCIRTFGSKYDFSTRIALHRIEVPFLVRHTPLECFLFDNKRIKLNMGAEFLQSSQDIITLLLMWHNEGQFLNYGLGTEFFRYPGKLDQKSISKSFFVNRHGIMRSALIGEKGNPEIESSMEFIAKGIKETGRIQININKVFNAVIEGDAYDDGFFTSSLPTLNRKHYGILSYDHSAAITRESNVGDEIQALSGLQFLPYNDVFLDRDTWKVIPKDSHCFFNSTRDKDPAKRKLLIYGKQCSIPARRRSVTAFLNAWYGRSRQHWPPLPAVDPVLFSMYAGPLVREMFSTRFAVSYMRDRGPVGARDTGTLEFFRAQNIPSFLSACATLMFRGREKSNRTEYLIADVKGIDTKTVIPKRIHRTMTKLTHIIKTESRFDRKTRLQRAVSLIDRYANAKLVVTARIHVALPCVAMGVPVIFLNYKHLPGGGGNRTAGLLNLFHTFNIPDDVRKLKRFNFESPPPNPQHELVLKYRARMWHVLRKREDLRDTAMTYGIVPFARYGDSRKREYKFRMILLTESDVPFSARSLESILNFHPYSRVTVYYSKIHLVDHLREYNESGYNVKFKKLSLDIMIQALKYDEDKEFIEKIERFEKKLSLLIKVLPNAWVWKIVETFVKLGLQYLEGGVFVDSKLLLLRPVRKIAGRIYYFESDSDNNKIAFLHTMRLNKNWKLELELFASTFALRFHWTKKIKIENKVFSIQWDPFRHHCHTETEISESHIGISMNPSYRSKSSLSTPDEKCSRTLESICVICG